MHGCTDLVQIPTGYQGFCDLHFLRILVSKHRSDMLISPPFPALSLMARVFTVSYLLADANLVQ